VDRTTSEWYEAFATQEAHGRSPLYERLALLVAGDEELLHLLARVPEPKRQPNLLFASARSLGWTSQDPETFRIFVLERSERVLELLRNRVTQTNEVGRCSVLLPALARIGGPVALVEVGASAGLCLMLDRIHYDYDGLEVGDAISEVQLRCHLRGDLRPPLHIPQIVWRRGIDLSPIDASDTAAVRWLEACVWADQSDRLERLRAALRLARLDPPSVLRGDLLDATAGVISDAPQGATLVVMHSATLAYLIPEQRDRFARMMESLDGVWVSNEAPGVVPRLEDPVLRDAERRGAFVLGQDGRILGLADPHGDWLEWMDKQ